MRYAIVGVLCFLAGFGAAVGAMAAGWFDPRPTVEPPPNEEWGKFLSVPKVELLGDGRLLRLTEDFAYVDRNNTTWIAPKGSIVDGASIPWPLWSVTGGPLEGKYRNASIVHDVECDRKTKAWDDVHLMFYDACRCGGVPEVQAKTLYAAVYHFGPRWDFRQEMKTKPFRDRKGRKKTAAYRVRIARPTKAASEPDAALSRKLRDHVERRNPSLDELRKLDPAKL
jgi:hypothetical protein